MLDQLVTATGLANASDILNLEIHLCQYLSPKPQGKVPRRLLQIQNSGLTEFIFLESHLRWVGLPGEEPVNSFAAIVGKAGNYIGVSASSKGFRKGQTIDGVEQGLGKTHC